MIFFQINSFLFVISAFLESNSMHSWCRGGYYVYVLVSWRRRGGQSLRGEEMVCSSGMPPGNYLFFYSFILACNLHKEFIVICSHLMMQRKESTTWKASKPPANPLLKSTFPDHFHLFAFTKEIDQRFHRIKIYQLVYVNDCLSLVFWTTSMPMAASTTMLWRWCWTDWSLLRLILQHGLICKQDSRHGF